MINHERIAALRERLGRPATLTRAGVAVAVAVGFVLASTAIEPDDTRAAGSRVPAFAETAPSARAVPLGTLVGKGHCVHIHATPEGPRFSVTDARGVLMGEGLTAEEMASRFPDIELPSMFADATLHAGSR